MVNVDAKVSKVMCYSKSFTAIKLVTSNIAILMRQQDLFLTS